MLFSQPIVEAILEGRKRMTRRVVPTQPTIDPQTGDWLWQHADGSEQVIPIERWIKTRVAACKYGKPGDKIWVKETFYAFGHWMRVFDEKKGKEVWMFSDCTAADDAEYKYYDDPPAKIEKKRDPKVFGWYKRPSIFMPRAGSRILLEITDIRAEQLQDISRQDAIEEGVDWQKCPLTQTKRDVQQNTSGKYASSSQTIDYVGGFKNLWQSINGKESWEQNPWVFVISFKNITS